MSQYDKYFHTFSATEVRSKEFVHTWKITNFVEAHPGIGESMYNVKKINEGDLWFLSLFADGWDGNHSEYISIVVQFFKNVVRIEKECYPYLFRIYILDKNQKEHAVYKEDDLDKEYILVTKLVLKDYLFDEKNEFLTNGNLIIRCRINFPGEIIEKPNTHLRKPKHDGFENIFNKEQFSDVKITVGEEIFWAYKGILSTQSPIFSAMFEHDMIENKKNTVEITDIDHEVVQEMLRYIYIGKVENIEKIAVDLLAAADKYEIDDLKLICEETLIRELNVKTVVNSLVLAEKLRAKLLKEAALDFFKLHAKEIVKNEKCKADCDDLSPVLSEIIKTLVIKK